MSGFDPTNPAFRPPGLPGYPPPSPLGGPPHPGVCRDPFCRDPSCPTAAYSAYLARISGAAAAGLPPGYLELLEAYKMYAPPTGLPGLLTPPPPPPTTSSAAVSGPASAAAAAAAAPYICNWMNGRDYCGKRFGTAEELLVHLKTHTNLSVSDAHLTSAASLSAAYSSLFAGKEILPSCMFFYQWTEPTFFSSCRYANFYIRTVYRYCTGTGIKFSEKINGTIIIF
jgi:hypothetical protein